MDVRPDPVLSAPTDPSRAAAGATLMFMVMVATLPLHTVFLPAWISWKPWLVALVVVAGLHAVAGVRDRTWPWHRAISAAGALFLVAMASSWSGAADERYVRLLLALGVGLAVLLVTERELRAPGMMERTLRVVFWSGAAMAISALMVSVLSVGALGETALQRVNDLPGIERVAVSAYRSQGFIAVTNWHQDPGYAAAWLNLWATLGSIAALRGWGSRRLWLDATVVGGLWFAVVMTLSRTGLLGTVVAGMALLWHHRDRLREMIRFAALSMAVVLVLLAAVWAVDRPGVGGDLGTALSFRFSQGLTLGPGDPDPDGGVINDSRSEVWPIYIDAFREHPIRGIGLGTGWANEIQEPHNLLLELLGETGLIGFTGFALLFTVVVRRAHNPIGRTALIVALAAAITQTVLFEATWWFAAGLAVAPDRGPPLGGDPA
jgi:O-antigen ligase